MQAFHFYINGCFEVCKLFCHLANSAIKHSHADNFVLSVLLLLLTV